jgi:hypothetical protein
MLTSTKSCTILIVTRTMSIISINMALEKHHANPTLTHTNILVSSIVTVTLLIFTIDTNTSEKRREIHSRLDGSNMLAHLSRYYPALCIAIRSRVMVQ